MAPFTGNRIGAGEHLAVDDNTAADTGSQDYAKNHCDAGGRAIRGLG